jgi:hypothetical protein
MKRERPARGRTRSIEYTRERNNKRSVTKKRNKARMPKARREGYVGKKEGRREGWTAKEGSKYDGEVSNQEE